MPRRPTRACPICRRVGCDDPKHKAQLERVRTSTGRTPSYQERKRNAALVKAWRAEHGDWCPHCGAVDYHEDGTPVVITADHVTPVALGGDPFGPLQPMCKRCQAGQGQRVANALRRGAR